MGTRSGPTLVAGALLLAPVGAAAQDAGNVEPYVFEANGGDTVHAELGRFRVPLDRSRGGPDSLELAFVRFPASGPEPGPPIVYLAGGPGGSGIATARGARFELFMALREFGDVIAFDQRGTGMSEGPSPATCPIGRNLPASEPLEETALRELTLQVARECGEFWREQGVDLGAYNTRESADDLADLAAALDAPRLRLWAISYGTHLGLAAMRRHPGLVERAILAGVEGPDHTVKLPAQWETQLGNLERLVAADPAGSEFPDLRGMIEGVLDRLERRPAPVEMISADRADTVRSVVSRFAVTRRTIDLLRDPSTLVTVPHLFQRMAEGNFSPVAGSSGAGGLAAMADATDAASGISAERLERFLHQDSTTLLGGGDQLTGAYMADALGVPDLGDDFRGPVRSDIPVLLISGTLDGRTPVQNALDVMTGLPNAEHLIIENAGHSDDLFLSSPRILDVMRAFLAGRPLPTTRLVVAPPDLESGRLPPALPPGFEDELVGAYQRGPADVWRIVYQGAVRSLGDDGEETGRTTFLQVRIRGNGFPLAANADTSFSIPFFGPDVRFRFVRGAAGQVERLEFTDSAGEVAVLTPVRWEDVAFVEGESWLIADPYRLEEGEGCSTAFPIEDELSRVARPGSVDWQPGSGDDGFVDFEEIFGGSTLGGVGYASLMIHAPRAMPVELRLGSDDDARVFLGDELIHSFDGMRHAWEAQDVIPTTLREGVNHLLVKVCNRDSDWRFNLRITDDDGRSVVERTERTEPGAVRLAVPTG
ncbi:MAG: alpha/beta fold hydrolase [Gemmatimonadota bacterium]